MEGKPVVGEMARQVHCSVRCPALLVLDRDQTYHVRVEFRHEGKPYEPSSDPWVSLAIPALDDRIENPAEWDRTCMLRKLNEPGVYQFDYLVGRDHPLGPVIFTIRSITPWGQWVQASDTFKVRQGRPKDARSAFGFLAK